MSTYTLPLRNKLLNFIDTLTVSLANEVSLRLMIPTNIVNRTEMICEYISDEIGMHFRVEDFIMVIYLDFIKNSIKKYDPMRIYHEISESYGYNDKIKIVCGNETYEYDKLACGRTDIVITMDKKEARKGQLLLKEIGELYGRKISLDLMISTLWINFIERYKRGDTEKSLKSILKILKSC